MVLRGGVLQEVRLRVVGRWEQEPTDGSRDSGGEQSDDHVLPRRVSPSRWNAPWIADAHDAPATAEGAPRFRVRLPAERDPALGRCRDTRRPPGPAGP